MHTTISCLNLTSDSRLRETSVKDGMDHRACLEHDSDINMSLLHCPSSNIQMKPSTPHSRQLYLQQTNSKQSKEFYIPHATMRYLSMLALASTLHAIAMAGPISPFGQVHKSKMLLPRQDGCICVVEPEISCANDVDCPTDDFCFNGDCWYNCPC